jgi:rhamnosyltransferase
MMSPAKPNVYVLMAVYNGEPWLPVQIQSVLNQEDVTVRLFISVDVSEDDSLAYCQRLSKENPTVEVLGYGERFGSATRNFSRLIAEVDTAEADFVAFCDQDDIWDSDKLIRSIKALSEQDCSAVSMIRKATTGTRLNA